MLAVEPRALHMLDRSHIMYCFQTDLFQNSSSFHVDPPGSLAFSFTVLSCLEDISQCRQELHLDAKVHGCECDEIEGLHGLRASLLDNIKDKALSVESVTL